MSALNIEIKAKCENQAAIRAFLLENKARFAGTDEQKDTYFQAKSGRLKLRQGPIENNLIYYDRTDQAGPKSSWFELFPVNDPARLEKILEKAMGVKVIVQKSREIYFLDNVKFHLDTVPQLGTFVEIEACNIGNDLDEAQLRTQCQYYMEKFGIQEKDLVTVSYSDLMMVS